MSLLSAENDYRCRVVLIAMPDLLPCPTMFASNSGLGISRLEIIRYDRTFIDALPNSVREIRIEAGRTDWAPPTYLRIYWVALAQVRRKFREFNESRKRIGPLFSAL